MTINIMGKYINITKKEINTYMKLIFDKRFNKKISETYLDAYINFRYYNYYDYNNQSSYKSFLLDILKEKERNLIEEYPKKKTLIENMSLFYYYILKFDNLYDEVRIKEEIVKLEKLINRKLKRQEEGFKQKFYETLEKYAKEKKELLDNFSYDKFKLKINSYLKTRNVYNVNLQYNIKFPMIYSNRAIEKVFNTGVIKENKLIVEYYLVTVEIIKEIVKGNFKKQYIVEFASALFKKVNKLKTLLNIINNIGIQDKINLKLTYSDFIENKENIYELMRNGFKIAVVIDESFIPDYEMLEKLNMFSYVIINKNLESYDEILKNRVGLNNIVEI